MNLGVLYIYILHIIYTIYNIIYKEYICIFKSGEYEFFKLKPSDHWFSFAQRFLSGDPVNVIDLLGFPISSYFRHDFILGIRFCSLLVLVLPTSVL